MLKGHHGVCGERGEGRETDRLGIEQTSVAMSRHVAGDTATTPDQKTWKPLIPLGYGRRYTLRINAAGTDSAAVSQTSTFTTLGPPAQTKVYLTTTAGTEFEDGGTYGVGTVVVAHFDEPITDRGAAEHSLQSRQARP